MNIASVHNHPKRYCSPPSGRNFEMLGFEFETFEIISSQNELWILEFCELIPQEKIEEIRENADNYFELLYNDLNIEFEKGYLVMDYLNRIYGDYLLNYLNDVEDIKLIRRYLNE